MNVGILIISHNGIGAAILGTANFMIKDSPVEIKVLTASRDCEPDDLLLTASDIVTELDQGDGVLILTDLIGSTPSNIAARLTDQGNIKVVCGLNLSMLIRVMNYHSLDLEKLAEKALSGGLDGVKLVDKQ